ncbi:MAG: hypothetical protein HF982_09200 [Desulfobacteraceae bacterium]|nr:hypothetical protein [Desulfobacteraceae bacterium]MBC2719745.1 hypothetical protein [Desulfobacteraceae bacterium]
MSNTPLNLIRYLFILNVNSSLVWLPKWPSIELSFVLGNTIADQLPTTQARPWKKALAACDLYGMKLQSEKKKRENIPESPWPIDAILFWYPVKRTYRQNERILLELKLVGQCADHGLFLEVILPAIENIGKVTNSHWHYTNCLWGHFDIQSIYTAQGTQWKPLVNNGHLDLRYKVNPSQWSKGLKFNTASSNAIDRLTWLAPFELKKCGINNQQLKKTSSQKVPSITCILEEIVQRMSSIILGKHATCDDFLEILESDVLLSWREAMEQASHIPLLRHNITSAPSDMPGQWIGSQTFATFIPTSIIPYLEFGSIFHIGKYTHYGCGNFVMI